MISTLIFVATVVVVYLTKSVVLISNDLISLFVFGIETIIVYVVLSLCFNRKTLVNIKNL